MLRFGRDLTRAEAGDRLGVSRMPVSRLLTRLRPACPGLRRGCAPACPATRTRSRAPPAGRPAPRPHRGQLRSFHERRSRRPRHRERR
ncbi:sigma factor-like helix-turn-helix DNA-binding protein [Streptomyces sp. NPDC054849]